MMAASCMLSNPMAGCASCDVRQSPDTLRDVIPLTEALRDVITLSSHCHHLMSPPPPPTSSVISCSLDPSPLVPTFPAAPSSASPSPPYRERIMHCTSRRSPVGDADRDMVSSPRQVVDKPFPPVSPSTGIGVEPLPLLNVSSEHLRYRGEGAEHIVLRVLSSGQVLRLRKTVVGAGTSRKNLVVRARKDEEFLSNVARPFLGPLLTDESRLVHLDSGSVRQLNDKLTPKRQVQRRHKEINNEGIACICPDAASIFIKRCSPFQSTTPTEVSSPITTYVPSLSTLASSSSLIESVSNHVQSQVQGLQNNDQDVLTVAMCSKLASRHLSQEAKVDLNLRTKVSPSTSSLSTVSGQLSDCRSPLQLQSDRSVFVTAAEKGSLSLSCPINIDPSVPIPMVSMEPRNICIEIKPKQGFIDNSTPETPLCRYCVKQYIKVGKEAEKMTSHYCPLDLFSGKLARMRKAIDGLLESPQNNLKVFVDGESVDNCLSFRYLRDVIITALLYDFTTAKSELQDEGHLSPRSPLGRTLSFQTLDQLGVFKAVNLYDHLVRVIGQTETADALLQDVRCWTKDSQFCQSDNEHCTRCTNGAPRWHEDGSLESHLDVASAPDHPFIFEKRTEKLNSASEYAEGFSTCESSPMDEKEDLSVNKYVDDNSSLLQGDIVRKLQKYLFSTTAKDLSLMILLSGPHKSSPAPSNIPNSSPFIIEVENGMWFLCQVTGVDLVAKPPSKILKHEKDYLLLKNVLEDLKKQGREPFCCRQ